MAWMDKYPEEFHSGVQRILVTRFFGLGLVALLIYALTAALDPWRIFFCIAAMWILSIFMLAFGSSLRRKAAAKGVKVPIATRAYWLGLIGTLAPGIVAIGIGLMLASYLNGAFH